MQVTVWSTLYQQHDMFLTPYHIFPTMMQPMPVELWANINISSLSCCQLWYFITEKELCQLSCTYSKHAEPYGGWIKHSCPATIPHSHPKDVDNCFLWCQHFKLVRVDSPTSIKQNFFVCFWRSGQCFHKELSFKFLCVFRYIVYMYIQYMNLSMCATVQVKGQH